MSVASTHGSVRMQYYAERISKQGYNLEPSLEFTQNGPSAGTYFGDNAVGHYVAYQAMEEAITMAENSGIGMVGVKEMGHSGAIGYFAEQAAKRGMVAITVCQSDPMVVNYGGTKPYFARILLHLLHHDNRANLFCRYGNNSASMGKILMPVPNINQSQIHGRWTIKENRQPTHSKWRHYYQLQDLRDTD